MDRNRRFDRKVLAAVLAYDGEVGARTVEHRFYGESGARISNALERLCDDGYLVARMNDDGLRRYVVAGRLGGDRVVA